VPQAQKDVRAADHQSRVRCRRSPHKTCSNPRLGRRALPSPCLAITAQADGTPLPDRMCSLPPAAAARSGQKNNLTAQMLALEQMNVTREVLTAQKTAASEMKSMTAALGGIEGVDDLQAEIQEGMDDAQEIQASISAPMTMPGVDGLDDDELLAELEGMEEEDLAAELSKVEIAAPSGGVAMPAAPTSQPLPSAPTSAISAEEEDELAALERSMAM
jgi:hypothetical protein